MRILNRLGHSAICFLSLVLSVNGCTQLPEEDSSAATSVILSHPAQPIYLQPIVPFDTSQVRLDKKQYWSPTDLQFMPRDMFGHSELVFMIGYVTYSTSCFTGERKVVYGEVYDRGSCFVWSPYLTVTEEALVEQMFKSRLNRDCNYLFASPGYIYHYSPGHIRRMSRQSDKEFEELTLFKDYKINRGLELEYCGNLPNGQMLLVTDELYTCWSVDSKHKPPVWLPVDPSDTHGYVLKRELNGGVLAYSKIDTHDKKHTLFLINTIDMCLPSKRIEIEIDKVWTVSPSSQMVAFYDSRGFAVYSIHDTENAIIQRDTPKLLKVMFSKLNNQIMTFTRDGKVSIYSIPDGKEVYSERLLECFLNAEDIVINETGNLLAIGAYERSAVWRIISADTFSSPNSLAYPAEVIKAFSSGDVNTLQSYKEMDYTKSINSDCSSPLMVAAYYGHTELAKYLLEHKAKVKDVDLYSCSTLAYAAIGGKCEMVNLLLDNGAKIDSVDSFGSTPLLHAIRHGHQELAVALIKKGADYKLLDKQGVGVLHLAAQYDCELVVDALIKEGAELDVVSEKMLTPLWVAVRYSPRVARKLIAAGADVNLTAGESDVPMLFAVLAHRPELLDEFIGAGADVKPVSTMGVNALMLASTKEAAVKLVELGLDVHARDRHNSTALMYAVSRNSRDLVLYLIEQDADVNAKNRFKETPLVVAQKNKLPQLEKLLREHGAVEVIEGAQKQSPPTDYP